MPKALGKPFVPRRVLRELLQTLSMTVREGTAVKATIWSGPARLILQGPLQYLRRYLPKPLKNLLKKTGMPSAVQRWLSTCIPYEPDVCSIIEQMVRPGWICADVGAHIGVITRLLAKLVGPAGRVIAFEAHPENARVLRENLSANGWGKAVTVENLAVSDGSCDRVWLFPGRESSSAEWNIVGHDVNGTRTEPEVEVRAVSLDEYFPPGSRLDLVKM